MGGTRHDLKESHLRSILEASTYRTAGTISTGILVYAVSGDFDMSFAVASLEPVVKMIVYYLHEPAWKQLPRGSVRRWLSRWRARPSPPDGQPCFRFMPMAGQLLPPRGYEQNNLDRRRISWHNVSYDRWAMSGKSMSRFKDILCVATPLESGNMALERAVTLAAGNGADLTVVDVVESSLTCVEMPADLPSSAELQTAMTGQHLRQLSALVEPYRKRVAVKTAVLTGVPFLQLIRQVLRKGHDLVVKVADNPDWLDLLFSSDDMHLLRKCPCPVWLVKPQPPKPWRRILAAVDVDERYPPGELDARRALNQRILEIAGSLALSESAELHVAHAWYPIGESVMRGVFSNMPEQQIVDYVEQVRRQSERNIETLLKSLSRVLGQDVIERLKPHTHLVKGLARKEVPTLVRRIDPDLLVMGTVGRVGVPGFFVGNTAETILSAIDCSVLAIKPPGFITPVTMEADNRASL